MASSGKIKKNTKTGCVDRVLPAPSGRSPSRPYALRGSLLGRVIVAMISTFPMPDASPHRKMRRPRRHLFRNPLADGSGRSRRIGVPVLPERAFASARLCQPARAGRQGDQAPNRLHATVRSRPRRPLHSEETTEQQSVPRGERQLQGGSEQRDRAYRLQPAQ